MATSLRELEELQRQLRALLRYVGELIAVQEGEEKRLQNFGEPPPRTRIP